MQQKKSAMFVVKHKETESPGQTHSQPHHTFKAQNQTGTGRKGEIKYLINVNVVWEIKRSDRKSTTTIKALNKIQNAICSVKCPLNSCFN